MIRNTRKSYCNRSSECKQTKLIILFRVGLNVILMWWNCLGRQKSTPSTMISWKSNYLGSVFSFFKNVFIWSISNKQTNQFTPVQLLSHVWLLAAPWTAARQASRSITSSQNKFMSIESVMPSNHLILCSPVSSRFKSFPASGSFPRSQFFPSGGQSIHLQRQSFQWIFSTDLL